MGHVYLAQPAHGLAHHPLGFRGLGIGWDDQLQRHYPGRLCGQLLRKPAHAVAQFPLRARLYLQGRRALRHHHPGAAGAPGRAHRLRRQPAEAWPSVNIDYLATGLALATFFGISALMALSLNLEYGVAGVPNFGQAMFISIGAYTAGITYTRLLPWLGGRAGVDPCGDTLAKALALRTELMTLFPTVGFLKFALTVVLALAAGGLAGYLASYVALRVWQEWYLGLVLLVGR